jgi:hypothetical protein
MSGTGFQTTSSFYSDIEIGAVEIKDANSDVRATVGNETTSAVGLNTLPLGLYLSAAPTLVNNDTFPLTLTSDGRLKVDAVISVEIATEQLQVRKYPTGVSTDIGYRIGAGVIGPDLSMPTVERFQAVQTTITYVGGTDRVSSVVDTDAWGRTLTTTMTYGAGNRLTSISEVIT